MQTATKTSDAPRGETTQPAQLVERDAKYVTANLGPLASDFTPPKDCGYLSVMNDSLTDSSSTSYVNLGWGVQCDSGGGNWWQIKSSCYPSRYGTAWEALKGATAENLAIYPLFSPASICPTGFHAACNFGTSPVPVGAQKRAATTTATAATRDFVRLINSILDSTQSAVGCCPTGFRCLNDSPYICLSSATTSSVYAYDNGCPANPTVATWKNVAGPGREVWARAALLLLVRDDTQSQTNTGPSASVSGTTSGSEATPHVGGGGAGGGDQVSGGDGGLSTGAKAAIGASVPLAAIVAGLALFFFFRRRSRRRDESSSGAVQPTDSSAKEEAAAGTGAAATADYDPRQSDKFSQPASSFGLPVPDRAETVSPDASVSRVSELYGSTAQQARLHEDIMELPGELNAPVARRPIPEAP
ncbi:hypothetical protein ISF_07479 [Cordyceps fumosorosea ARSEF 2679]|uniref:LPXTG-motif cell wall anchor n=1 Tax=Cordyceps fumosorosea (strain ARSEF 2679) TaxID=1081104 RepID=A0A167P911_CORFA|nr:hypothetical protein ISF_07479 [Cordyceps fumosorosea ARSEF 2679]OAA56411.1 hypothetical protein ISF_07479 [Cordyceps fumosorosea ARSEF 2679]